MKDKKSTKLDKLKTDSCAEEKRARPGKINTN